MFLFTMTSCRKLAISQNTDSNGRRANDGDKIEQEVCDIDETIIGNF